MKTQRISIFAVMLLSFAAEAAPPPPGSVSALVSFKPGKKSTVKQAILAAGGKISYENNDVEAFAAELPAGAADTLAARADVAFVEEDMERHIQADTFDWGVGATQTREVWDVNLDGAFDTGAPLGAGRTVCIIDSGILPHHPDLAGAHIKGGISLVPDGPWDDDAVGHGTFIAGIIAAQRNGVGAIGLAPAVSIYSVRAIDNTGRTYSSLLMRAGDACVAAGANVINLSLGGDIGSRTEERYWAQLARKNVLLVAAAGNSGAPIHHFPASYDSVISVGSVDPYLGRSSFSNFSSQVELTAPGSGIWAAFPRQENAWVSVNGGPAVDGVALGGLFLRGVASGRLEWGGNCLEPGNFAGAIAICNFADANGTHLAIHNMIASGAAGLILVFHGSSSYWNDLDYPIVTLALRRPHGKDLVHHNLARSATINTITVYEPGYRTWQGTSFSTPHVAGVAALIWSKYPKKSAADIRAALAATARDLGPGGRDIEFGHGLIQAKAALQYLATH